MKLSPFFKNNVMLRKSIMQASGHNNLASHTIQKYLLDTVPLPWSVGRLIGQANRCSEYLEYIHSRNIRVNKFEHFIVLASIYIDNFGNDFDLISESLFLRDPLNNILKEAKQVDEKILLTVQKIVNLLTNGKQFSKNYEALLYLWTNLVLLPSNYILVLEDTDVDVASIPLSIKVEISRYV